MMEPRLGSHSPPQVDRLKRKPPLLTIPLRPDLGVQRIPLVLLIAEVELTSRRMIGRGRDFVVGMGMAWLMLNRDPSRALLLTLTAKTRRHLTTDTLLLATMNHAARQGLILGSASRRAGLNPNSES